MAFQMNALGIFWKDIDSYCICSTSAFS